MSIETTAPKKFLLQDLACIEMMLRFGQAGSAVFTIESGNEDADLSLGSGAERVHYEVQVKGAAGAVGVDELAGWLFHYPRLSAHDTALERLIRDPARRFVLVASGRCRDSLIPLLAEEGWVGEDHVCVTLKLARLVIDAWGRADPGGKPGSDLRCRRLKHRHEVVARGFSEPAVVQALRRVVLIEQMSRPRLEERICSALVRRGLPSDRCAVVTAGLRGVVDGARGTGADAMSATEEYLRAALPGSLRPREYQLRGTESFLAEELTHKSRLLLSGIARCGKSTAALWLASAFEEQGFEVRWTASVEAAEAFLDDPAPSLRLAVLDDPLGGAHPVPRADEALARLEALVRRAKDDRRLVVSQGQERLLATARQTMLSAVTTGGAGWHDLSAPSVSFLKLLWRHAADRHGFPEGLRDDLGAALSSGSLELGAGALDFLARQSASLPENATVEDAVRHARIDARTLGAALINKAKSPNCLTALLFASDGPRAVYPAELAFVLGAGGDVLPGLTLHIGTSITFGAERRAPRAFPDYATAPATDPQTRADLNDLERLNIVGSGRAGEVAFSHPFYREAVEAALLNPIGGEAAELMALHQRALFARESTTSRAAARNLDLLLHLMTPRPDGRRLVFDRAVEGLRAYFPPTRDLCFDFLMRHIAEASMTTGQPIVDWLHRVTHINLEELQWHGGEATLPIDGELNDDNILRTYGPRPRRSEVKSTLECLDGEGLLPSPEDAARALRHLARFPGLMTQMQAERLLSYEEGVIRGAAARCWLSKPRVDDAPLLGRLARDRHPLVAVGCLEGILQSLPYCAAHRRGELALLLVREGRVPALALALMDRLTVFERGSHADHRVAWRLFAPVMATAMRNLPAQTSFDTARLYNVMYEGRRHLRPRGVAMVARGWIGWILHASAAGLYLGSFATGVVSVLVAGTRTAPFARGDLIATVLGVEGTGALLRLLADAVDEWDWLREDEREVVTEAITAPARDATWRRAVALTRRQVPLALQAALMPVDSTLEDSAADIVFRLPTPLLEACLAVHCANPGRLHDVSLRDRSSVWEEVVAYIAVRGTQPLLGIVFGHVANEHDDQKVTTMVAAGMHEDPEATFRLLMAETMHRDLVHLAGAWQYLLGHAPSDVDRERWLDEVREAASRIFEQRGDVEQLFPEPQLAEEIRNWLEEDALFELITSALLQHSGPLNTELRDNAFALFEQMLVKTPPRILGTVDDVFGVLRQRYDLTPTLEEAVRARREAIIEARWEIGRRWNAERDPRNWVEPGSERSI
ncbi:hypothetical protein [Salinisphaera sp.]|uniref:nSTAND3 domain-containing NTPase n=1 Tax=Salinisphaera sp. TaxID=1914330 RepID=UPI002D76586E|nr:hypothetical protein [Salinisphaera sp.]HET7313048.1 hypothetical protein [Salinisphaera sp.]